MHYPIDDENSFYRAVLYCYIERLLTMHNLPALIEAYESLHTCRLRTRYDCHDGVVTMLIEKLDQLDAMRKTAGPERAILNLYKDYNHGGALEYVHQPLIGL
jgi:hypothetical protein